MKKGEKFSASFKITSSIYKKFQLAFRDKNPMHTDQVFAKKYGFDDKVMYGNILNGFISYFVGEILPIKNVVILTEEIQFHKPFYLNERLDFEAIVESMHESVSVYNFKFTFYNNKNTTVAQGKVQVKKLQKV